MILFGFAFGRWWRWSILSGSIVWAVLLFATHSMEGSSVGMWFGAILFGAVNAALGVALFLLARMAVRAFRLGVDSVAKR